VRVKKGRQGRKARKEGRMVWIHISMNLWTNLGRIAIANFKILIFLPLQKQFFSIYLGLFKSPSKMFYNFFTNFISFIPSY
jgi:hypothetical protein